LEKEKEKEGERWRAADLFNIFCQHKKSINIRMDQLNALFNAPLSSSLSAITLNTTNIGTIVIAIALAYCLFNVKRERERDSKLKGVLTPFKPLKKLTIKDSLMLAMLDEVVEDSKRS
jgi:hypothetical protein